MCMKGNLPSYDRGNTECRLEKFPSRNLASGAPEKCMSEVERSEAEFCTFQRSESLLRRKFFRATVSSCPAVALAKADLHFLVRHKKVES